MSTPKPLDLGSLLPWYLNGTLTEAERHDVESWLGQSEEGQAELLLWRAVQLDTRNRALADGGAEIGWRRMRAQLPEPEPVSMPVAPVSSPSGRETRHWRWAAAASVIAILGLQSVLLLRSPVDQVHRPLSLPGATTDSWQLQLRFAGQATLVELNDLLLRHGASIVEGPSALGIYTVSVPRAEAQSIDALLADLRAEPLVLQVSVAP